MDIKIVLFGEDFTGKSCFLFYLLNYKFDKTIPSTLSPKTYIKSILINEKKYNVEIWDTPGLKQYRILASTALRDANGVLLFYDITDFQSFKSLSKTISEIRLRIDAPIMIVGNKIDQKDHRKVSKEYAIQFSDEQNVLCNECSSLTGENVHKSFESFVQEVIKDMEYKLYTSKLQIQIEDISKPGFFNLFPFLRARQPRAREQNSPKEKNNYFIGEEEEKKQEILEKVGEGSTYIAYKVIDRITSQVMCKKILKPGKSKTFADARNAIKEFEVLYNLDHPCICKSIGINMCEILKQKPEDLTTISLFLEFLPHDLKKCIDENMLDSTTKAKIAVEIASAMNYLHKRGMIHRDLKVNNVMLTDKFEAKLIDFELVKEFDVEESLSKGVGTIAYMSPEMQNEDEYNEKTDVYSFGVLLHVLFTGQIPNQKQRDKLNGILPNLPKPSDSISDICIELIKMCLAGDPDDRPSFEQILEYLNKNHFMLVHDIDYGVVFNRFCNLSKFN